MTLQTAARPQGGGCKERALLSGIPTAVEGNTSVKQPGTNAPRHSLTPEWQALISSQFQLPHPDYPQEAHDGHVYTIQLAGKWLVSGGSDKTIRVWDLEARRLRGEPLVGHSQSVLCLQFDHSEKQDVIISGSSDCAIILWRFSTGQPLKIIPAAHQESILDLRFSRTQLFTASKDKTIKIWNRHELTPLDQGYPRFQEDQNTRVPNYVLDVSSTEPTSIDAGLADGSIQILRPYSLLATLCGHNAAVNAVDFHGNTLVSGSGDRSIRVWDITTGQCLRQLIAHQKGIAAIQTDGKLVVSGGSDSTIRIHDLDTGTQVTLLRGHSNLVRSLQVDFEGVLGAGMDRPDAVIRGYEDSSRWNRIVSGSYDESIVIWRKRIGELWQVEHTLDLKVVDASLPSIDHAMQATSVDDQEQQALQLRVFKVKFDRRRLVCSSQDSRIYCWEFAASQAESFVEDTDHGAQPEQDLS